MFDKDDPNRILNFRPLLFMAVGLLSGVLLFETLAGFCAQKIALIPIAAGLFVLAASGAAILLVKKKTAIFLFLTAFAVGVIRMFFATPDGVETGNYSLSGTVSSVSEIGSSSVIVDGVRLNGRRLRYPVRLCVTSDGAQLPSVGDSVSADVFVEKDFSGHSEGNRRNLSNGYSFSAKCVSFETSATGGMKLKRLILSVRSAIKNRIFELFPDNAATVSGFLLGDRSDIDYDELESFRITGTAHLLSLSGFHVGVLAGLLTAIFPRRFRKLRFIFIVLFLAAYCAVAAFPPSLVRASIMTAAVLLADLFDRRRDPMSSLSLAAIVIVLVSPYELWSVGFRLSFAAMLGIILFAEIGTVNSRSRAVNRITGTIAVTFSALLATALITARCFGYVNTYSIPANIIAVPVYSAAIVMSFSMLVLSFPFPTLAGFVSWAPDKLIGGSQKMLSFIANLPYARIYVTRPPAVSGFLMLLLLFIISPYVLRPIKKRLIAAIPVLILFTLSLVLSIIKA